MIILLPTKIAQLTDMPRELRVRKLAHFFEDAWALAMNGQARVSVGLYCQRDWIPADKSCPMQNTAEALMDAGGLPVPIYLGGGEPAEQLSRVSALVLPGGQDIDPVLYGAFPEPGSPAEKLDGENDRFQKKCVLVATQMALPMLGLGRGARMLNLAHGGTLEQTVPPGHQKDGPPAQASHAVGELAEGFQVVGPAPDGTIECIERKRPWAVGCEFYSESQCPTDPAKASFFLRLVRRAERVVLPPGAPRVRVKVFRNPQSRFKRPI